MKKILKFENLIMLFLRLFKNAIISNSAKIGKEQL